MLSIWSGGSLAVFRRQRVDVLRSAVAESELHGGSVYFSVQYLDDDMLLPVIETLVFLGRNLDSGDTGQLYFQDAGSYAIGVRYGSPGPPPMPTPVFYAQAERDTNHIFEYEHALEVLMACSLRRQKRPGEARGFEPIR